MLNQLSVGQVNVADGSQPTARGGRTGETIVSGLHGRYYEQARRGNVFVAQAIVTAPVIYTTVGATGGPLLWNGSTTVNAAILAVGWGVSTVSTVAAAFGLTGNSGQPSAPTSTTAIDGRSNLLIGGSPSACTPYRIGTVAVAGGFLFPLGDLNTGALTTTPGGLHWVDLGGAFVVPPQCWCSPSVSATASTTVMTIGLIWEEIPL
jgi:hypothetical protein